ncbi:uncharacterized protein LOC144555042 isoform X1 [Carex rostrata]
MGIFGARIQGLMEEACGQVVAAYGSVVKPCFERVSVCYGVDVKLEPARVGVLLPVRGRAGSQKSQDVKTQVTALDRANAEDAILPLPKLYAHDKKRKHDGLTDSTVDLKPILGLEPSTTVSLPVKKGNINLKHRNLYICIEDRMRELGLLGAKIDLSSAIGIQIEKNWSMRMIRQHVNAMSSDEVGPLFDNLVSAWRIRSAKSSNKILEWMYCLLVYHGHHILSRKSSLKLFDDLQETIVIKSGLLQELLKLSGRLQLIRKQIDMAGEQTTRTQIDEVMGDASEEHEDDQEDEEIDEMVYGEEEDASDMD